MASRRSPPEWQALNAAWDRRDLGIRASTLRALGHHDIADVLERDPEASVGQASGNYDLWGEPG